MAKPRNPKLPQLLDRKIYKTGQTRGADDDEIFQNRVGRNSTVLIPYTEWKPEYASKGFENGYIVLIPPRFIDHQRELKAQNIILGTNALLFYETRRDWFDYNPETKGFVPATSRTAPLGGQYVARVPATTANAGNQKINLGFTEKKLKGAGIRFYEYADHDTINAACSQLEAIFWHCEDAVRAATEAGMSESDINQRKEWILDKCRRAGLLDYQKLREKRILDADNHTVCPLCLERLQGRGFMTRLSQMRGREVPDLTVTEVSLFHIHELRAGEFNHKPYNLGWGHHHCNVVVKDSGIFPTLKWFVDVLNRNRDAGFSDFS